MTNNSRKYVDFAFKFGMTLSIAYIIWISTIIAGEIGIEELGRMGYVGIGGMALMMISLVAYQVLAPDVLSAVGSLFGRRANETE